MPQAAEIINPALKLLGVIAQGETPAASETADALAALNAMIDNWKVEDLNMIPRSVQTISLSGAASYSLSPRPTRVLAAQHALSGGVSLSVRVATAEEFTSVPNYGAVGGPVVAVWYDQQQGSPTLHVAPSASAGTLRLYVLGDLPSFASATDNQTLPVGYLQALIASLAVELAPMFGQVASPNLIRNAENAKAAIRSANAANSNSQPGGPVSAAQA